MFFWNVTLDTKLVQNPANRLEASSLPNETMLRSPQELHGKIVGTKAEDWSREILKDPLSPVSSCVVPHVATGWMDSC